MGETVKLDAVKCPACQGALARSSKTYYDKEEEENVSLPIAKCTACGKEYDRHAKVYYELFADDFLFDKDAGPFRLGQKGKIDGVEYEIIGRLRYQDEDDYEKSTWDEWVTINADGVYRYFVEEDGEIYAYDEYVPQSIDMESDPGKIIFEGKKIDRASGYIGRIVYAEGELPWKPEIGEPITEYDFRKDGFYFTIETTEDEVSITKGEKIPEKKVVEAFGTGELKKRYDVRVDREKSLKQQLFIFIGGVVVSLALAMQACVTSGQVVPGVTKEKTVITANEPRNEENTFMYFSQVLYGPFEINEKKRLYTASVSVDQQVQPLHLEWQTAKVLFIQENRFNKLTNEKRDSATLKAVFDEMEALPEPVESFEVVAEFWDEEGYDSEGHWHESDLSGSTDFVPDETGRHYAYVELYSNKPRKPESVALSLEKTKSYRYYLIAAMLFGGLAYITRIRARNL